MAVSYDKIFRRIALKANQLQASSALELQGVYTTPVIGQTEMGDRGVEFPKEAIDDAIIDAMSRMLNAIAMNRYSSYRRFWMQPRNTLPIIGKLYDGYRLPLSDKFGRPIMGMMVDFFDDATAERLEEKSYEHVIDIIKNSIGAKTASEVKIFYTDGTKIWHTVNSCKADTFLWQPEVERTLMESVPRGNTTLPDELVEMVVIGALAYLFRDNFNIEQVQIWQQMFIASLGQLSAPAST